MQLTRIRENFSKMSDYMPRVRFSSREEIMHKIKLVSIPAIALVGATLIQGAKADDFTDCIKACDEHRDAHELAKLLCYTMCWFITK